MIIPGARRGDLEVAAKELDVDAVTCDSADPASLDGRAPLLPPSPRHDHQRARAGVDAGDPRTYTLSHLAAAWRNTWTPMLSAVLTVKSIGDHLRSGGSIVNVVPDNPRDGSADAAIKAALSNWTSGQATLLRRPRHHDQHVAGARSRAVLRRVITGTLPRSPPRSGGWRCS